LPAAAQKQNKFGHDMLKNVFVAADTIIVQDMEARDTLKMGRSQRGNTAAKLVVHPNEEGNTAAKPVVHPDEEVRVSDTKLFGEADGDSREVDEDEDSPVSDTKMHANADLDLKQSSEDKSIGIEGLDPSQKFKSTTKKKPWARALSNKSDRPSEDEYPGILRARPSMYNPFSMFLFTMKSLLVYTQLATMGRLVCNLDATGGLLREPLPGKKKFAEYFLSSQTRLKSITSY